MQTPSEERDFAKTQFSARNDEEGVSEPWEKTGEANCDEPPKTQDCRKRPHRETEIIAPSEGTVLSKKLQYCSQFRISLSDSTIDFPEQRKKVEKYIDQWAASEE
jgi:hypothetical protein